jgi:MFS transporter, OFA family, oxalate/formate antiporter
MREGAGVNFSNAVTMNSSPTWRYIILSFDMIALVMIISGGYIMRTMTAPSILKEFDITVGELSVVWAVANIVKVVGQYGAGSFMDLVGIPNTLRVSLIGVALTCVATGTSRSVGIYAAATLFQNGVFVLGQQPTHGSLMGSYFAGPELGFAMGLMNMGYSVAGAVMPLVCAPLLACCGWRFAYFVVAAVLFAYVPVVWKLLVLGPFAVGAASKTVDHAIGMSFAEVRQRPSFWTLLLCGVLFKAWEGTVTAHLPLILELEGGATVEAAAGLYSIIFACAIVGKLACSTALLYVPIHVLSGIGPLGFFASHFLLVVVDVRALASGAALTTSVRIAQSYSRLCAFAVVYGVCYGATMTILVYQPARLYGKRALPQAMSFFFGSIALGELLLPTAVGMVHDVYNYATALMLTTFTSTAILFVLTNVLAWTPAADTVELAQLH